LPAGSTAIELYAQLSPALAPLKVIDAAEAGRTINEAALATAMAAVRRRRFGVLRAFMKFLAFGHGTRSGPGEKSFKFRSVNVVVHVWREV
jgi:hypothetical protein